MFNTKTVEIEWGGKTLKLETGRVARQADGAVLATLPLLALFVLAGRQLISGIMAGAVKG